MLEVQVRSKETPPFYYVHERLTNTTAYDLSGPYVGDRREPDQAITGPEDGYPLVVLELGVNDSTDNLFEAAKKWLEGSEGVTRVVIVIDIRCYQSSLGRVTIRENHAPGQQLFDSALATIYLCRKGEEPVLYWSCEVPEDHIVNSATSAPDAVFTMRELIGDVVSNSEEWADIADDKIDLPLEYFIKELLHGTNLNSQIQAYRGHRLEMLEEEEDDYMVEVARQTKNMRISLKPEGEDN
jgi:hypothetical protein